MNSELKNFLDLLRGDVIHAMQASGKYATGQTAKEITIADDSDNLQLQFPLYLLALETGRRPTGPNAQPGNPPMIQRIQEWCSEKGIPETAAWAIKKSIDKNGYKGEPGIISGPLSEDNIKLRLDSVLNGIAESITQTVIALIP